MRRRPGKYEFVLASALSLISACQLGPSETPGVEPPAGVVPQPSEPVLETAESSPAEVEPWLPPTPLEQPPPPPDYGAYVDIPGGEFDGHEIPPLSFKQTEVTVAEYHACFDRGECSSPDDAELCNWAVPDREQHPVNCVSWSQASDYCAWAGGRLPTQWEWMWAARGREAARPFPWGRQSPSCARAVISANGYGCGTDATWPVGSKPDGASVDGLHDMIGNVCEWTTSETERGVVKGGSWMIENPRFMRLDYAIPGPLDNQSFGDGFRCVRDITG